MLQHHSTQNQIIRLVEAVVHNVLHSKRPIGLTNEVLLMAADQIWNDVKSRVVNIISGLEESTHPNHVSARNVQQSNTIDTQLSFESRNDRMQCTDDLLRVEQR